MLEELILSGQIRKALEEVHDDKLLPVFIPSYKNRDFTIINQLNEVPSKVYLFVYEDDRQNYPKEFSENVILHIIKKSSFDKMNLPWHTLEGKREYMLEYAKKNNFDKVIVMDDDINFTVKISSKENKIEDCSIWECFKLIAKLSEKFDYGVVGIADEKNTVRHYNWKKLFNFKHASAGVILLNINNLKKYGIHYPTVMNKNILEDKSLIIECIINGLKAFIFDFACFICNEKWGGKHSIASTKNLINEKIMNFYVYYRDYAKLSCYKNRLYTDINWKNVEKGIKIENDDFHEELYNACKENNLEKVVNLLQNGIKKEFEEW